MSAFSNIYNWRANAYKIPACYGIAMSVPNFRNGVAFFGFLHSPSFVLSEHAATSCLNVMPIGVVCFYHTWEKATPNLKLGFSVLWLELRLQVCLNWQKKTKAALFICLLEIAINYTIYLFNNQLLHNKSIDCNSTMSLSKDTYMTRPSSQSLYWWMKGLRL